MSSRGWAVMAALSVGAIAAYGGCVGPEPTLDSVPSEAGTASSSGTNGACEDTTYCDDKCGASLKDKCGVVRDCATPCGDGRKCDGLRCVCASSASWCMGRCGSAPDNCGKTIDCGGCDGAPCSDETHTCNGCKPEAPAVTCAGKACGTATNNCGQEVVCGDCGTAACNLNRCCEPASVTCNGKCGKQISNCGLEVNCPSCCPNGKPNGDITNCGGCGRNCTGFVCTGGTCACPTHEQNSDDGNCGPCTNPIGPGPACTSRGFARCELGACR